MYKIKVANSVMKIVLVKEHYKQNIICAVLISSSTFASVP